jgi:mono/diheme cytochrome c family protein
MKEEEKQAYLENYQREKEKGVNFFPDLLYKDALVSLLIFVILLGLAYFLGAPLEERADPADTNYTPRPEWYFLFVFQLLKYFPGSLEVLGVIVIPAIALLLLVALPFLDRSAKRHYRGRLPIIGITALLMVGGIGLTIISIIEAPPPAEVGEGDPIAALYAENCAPCHGPSISVEPGTNLHTLIALGEHEGMPAWSADLTTDQIDALAGFIVSPAGSSLFTDNCGDCHEAPELVAGNPLVLRDVLQQGSSYPDHAEVDVPNWGEILSTEEQTGLLNFLAAPDGQRLFAVNCAPCHGRSVAFTGGESDLVTLISEGGLHLEMPPWRETLSDSELELLANYVVDPTSVAEGASLFERYCSACHGQRIPAEDDVDQARQVIASGGSHEMMPVWGEVLTDEQLDALVSYTLGASSGAPLTLGQQLYSQNCASCHGDFGEGGANPTRAGDIIAPISTAEYLKTRDDATLRAILAQGQPNFGMSPFGSAFGGPLDDDEIEAIVVYIRSWEANPPVELPPEIAATTVPVSGPAIYSTLCAQCHGPNGEGGIGPALNTPVIQIDYTDQVLFDEINLGHAATAMIAWGEILTADQIQQLVTYIRQLDEGEVSIDPSSVSFTADVMPIFEAQCTICHGTLGGWDGTSYEAAINTGDNAPVVIPGDGEGSLLGQKILGTQTLGNIMPPSGLMSEEEIAIILAWIDAGAPDN